MILRIQINTCTYISVCVCVCVCVFIYIENEKKVLNKGLKDARKSIEPKPAGNLVH